MGNGTSIGRVRGLGSANEGAHHWLIQRFTAIGNLVLAIWFVASLLLMSDLSYASVTKWFASPVTATAMALLVISTFWHARLGVQVLMEDYIKASANKFALLTLLNFAALGGAAFGLFCIFRLALGGA
ncbi:succinate dehydrogenase, hydrophobic membrane anchor protein [Altererythrobacter aquiaggeris]|uniref:succinate dehydrogenase, hydrophobic membrane anchor protein n=1 Tax=Aestuarierythrobacter aquiaggeris TaxID=1898396 RepID=UPI0030194ABC